ncbi:MAG: hypothetical protein AAGG79_01650 [Pseudomonadota bacterium]
MLDRMGLTPQKVGAEDDAPFRLLALRDQVTSLNFGCLYQLARADKIDLLAFVCILPAPQLSEDDAQKINARLPMAVAFLEGEDLWVYGEVNIETRFSIDLFKAQVEFFLTDMRTALQMVRGGDALSLAPAEALISLARQHGTRSPMVHALSNTERDQRPSKQRTNQARSGGQPTTPRQTFSTKQVCWTCNGTGRRWLRECRACGGSGFRSRH